MPNAKQFRLNRSGLLLALISSAFAGQVQASAGRVEFAIGGATLAGPNGQQRPAIKGAEVNSGDVVRTTDGRVQVRMADGAYISLQPNTEFGIKDYKFEGKTDGTESAFYSLLKGAMRTVTGLIGRVNRNRYQVATPTATVGIRGTGGLIQVLDDGSTLVQGTSGIWFLANPSGSIDVPAGVSGLSPSDPNQPPQETGEAPTSGPAPLPPQQEYVQGNQTESDGTTVITGNVLLSGSGYAAVGAYGANSDGLLPELGNELDDAVFNGAGQLIQYGSDLRAVGLFRLEAGGSHAEFGTDGIVAWGRWIGLVKNPDSFSGSENYNGNQGLHYVVGLPTASMPPSGQATYTLLGATKPTFTDGSASPGTFSGSLNVDFGANTVGLNLNVGIGGQSYTIGGAAAISGSTFSGCTFCNVGAITINSPTSCSCFGCSASVEGFFSGSTAERAGLGYNIEDFDAGKDTVGTAAFQK